MKGMPLPLDFEGKGVFDLEVIVKNRNFIADSGAGISSYFARKNCFLGNNFGEPNSVLDSAKIGSRPTSSSTLSSSLGGGGGGGGGAGGGAASTDTAGVAAVSDPNPSPRWQQDSTTATSSNAGGRADSQLLPIPPSLEIGTAAAAAGKFGMEDWESVLSESVGVSPSQEQSVLRWIMGDVEDPSMASLNKVLQIGTTTAAAASEFDYTAGFGVVDQGLAGDQFGATFLPSLPSFPNRSTPTPEKIPLPPNPNPPNPSTNFLNPSSLSNNLASIGLHPFDSPAEMKPPIFNSLINPHHQQPQYPQNPSSLFFPVSFPHLPEQNLSIPPQAKRHNPGVDAGGQISKVSLLDTGQQLQPLPHQLQFLPQYLHQRAGAAPPPQKPKTGCGDEFGHSHHQQAVVDQLYKAAELVQTGNPVLAQGILARLNHQLSPVGKPFNRAAFYCKEALQLLLHANNPAGAPATPPFGAIFKIGAYKSFSEISPLVQFANFTCNQALLEVLERFDTIHIVDFDIGYGTQWASLLQELAIRTGGAPSLKITAIVTPSNCDQIELTLTRENLIQFASEINIVFEFEVTSIDSLSSGSWALPSNEAVAVNLPISSLSNCQLPVPLVLNFVKQLSPRIVVSVDRGYDRTDLPFASYIINALQSYSNVLESLDAVNVNTDALQKIEKYLLQPGFEKLVLDRIRSPEKTPHWRAMFLSSGFTPVGFSNFTEAQAECVAKRTPVRGFQVEKRQSSLALCWQRKELISASAWRC
ncbi:scarecrow-like protein 27 [Andrographis paniculata]|uniref:scarecrow-like protein 27 n=1 Tax=Andrographis paniculata TaxID=175694 RepID=UPI0021E7C974|nr:scarecrow-like protein 27 [Andrographis paniculata]